MRKGTRDHQKIVKELLESLDIHELIEVVQANKDDILGEMDKISSELSDTDLKRLASGEYNYCIDQVLKMADLAKSFLNPKKENSDYPIYMPKLIAGENSSFPNILIHYEVINTPLSRKIFPYFYKKTNDSNMGTKAQEMLEYLHQFGELDRRKIPLVTAFSNSAEIAVLKKTAEIFDMPSMKNVTEFKNNYESVDSLISLPYEYLYSESLDIEKTETEYRNKFFINFLSILTNKLGEKDTKNLTEEESDLLSLTLYILTKFFGSNALFVLFVSAHPNKKIRKFIFDKLEVSKLDSYKSLFKDYTLSVMSEFLIDIINCSSSTEDAPPKIFPFLHLTDRKDRLIRVLSTGYYSDDIRNEVFSHISKNNPVNDIDCDILVDFINNYDDIIKDDDLRHIHDYMNMINSSISNLKIKLDESPKLVMNHYKELEEIKSTIENLCYSQSIISEANKIRDDQKKANEALAAMNLEASMSIMKEMSENIDNFTKLITEDVFSTLSCIDEISKKISETKEQKLRNNAPPASEELSLAIQRNHDQEIIIQDLEETVQRLTGQVTTFEQKISGINKKLSSEHCGLHPSLKKIIFEGGSVEDVYLSFKDIYPFVEFADGVEKSVSKSIYSYPIKLFKCLDNLASSYYPAIIKGIPDSEAKDLIAPYYKANESNTTLNDKRLRSLREFVINGKKKLFEKHMTIGEQFDTRKTIQVYFDIEGTTLQIGYIGEHLKTQN